MKNEKGCIVCCDTKVSAESKDKDPLFEPITSIRCNNMVSISVNNGHIKTMSGVLESSRAALSIGSTCILIGRLFENRLG